MKFCRQWKLLAAAAALATSTVMAQGPGAGMAIRTGGDSPNDPTYLLASESVKKELALSDEQQAGFQKLRDEETDRHPFASGGFRGLSREQIQTRLDQHAKANRNRVAKLLTPHQTDRLNEIHIQMAGVAALTFADVAKKLELSADQKAKLKMLGDEARRELADLNSANNNQPPDAQQRTAYMQKLSQIAAERQTKSLALLTDDQRTKFEKLQGKKFDTKTIQPNRREFTSRGRIEAPFPPAVPPPAQ